MSLVALTTGLAGLGVGIPRVASQDPRPDVSGGSLDRVDDAARGFAAEVDRLSAQADAVDRLWQVYRARCEPGLSKGYEFGREWFGLWDRAFVPAAADAGCAALVQRVVVEGGSVLMQLTAADSLARHGGVSPVTIQGMVRWNGLEWRPLTGAPTQRAGR